MFLRQSASDTPPFQHHGNCPSGLCSQLSEELNQQLEAVCGSVFGELESQAVDALDLPGCFRMRSHSYLRAIQAGCSQDDDCLPLLAAPASVSGRPGSCEYALSAPGPALGWRVIWVPAPALVAAVLLNFGQIACLSGPDEGMIRGSLRSGTWVRRGCWVLCYCVGVGGGRPQTLTGTAFLTRCVSGFPGRSLQLQKGPAPHPAGKPGPPPHLHHRPEQHRLRPRELHRGGGPSPALQLRGRAGRPGHGRAHPGVGAGATPGQPQAPHTHHQDHSWQGGAAEPGAAAEVAAVHRGSGMAGGGANESFAFSWLLKFLTPWILYGLGHVEDGLRGSVGPSGYTDLFLACS